MEGHLYLKTSFSNIAGSIVLTTMHGTQVFRCRVLLQISFTPLLCMLPYVLAQFSGGLRAVILVPCGRLWIVNVCSCNILGKHSK